jgi:flavin-dependent dehydrogenase
MRRTADLARPEIVVIGDGVAGLAAVRSLQQRGCAPALIAPARPHSGNRGEQLGPRALASLTALAWAHLLDDERLALPSEARFSAWGSPTLVRTPGARERGSGWYVDRTGLEAAMRAETAEGPGDRINASVIGCDRERDGWRLTLSTGRDVRTRFVIDASGRGSAIARRVGGPRRRESGLVAMHRTLAAPSSAVMAASLIETTPGGWWYTSTVPGGGMFAAFFTDADLLPSEASRRPEIVDPLLAAAPFTCARLESLGAVAPAVPWRVVVASTVTQERVAGDGWAAAGDAAIALDPLAGHGLTVALWSAIQTAAAARSWLRGDEGPLRTYQDAVATGMRRFIDDADRHYRAERRFREHAFWSRRQGLASRLAVLADAGSTEFRQ